MVMLGKRLLVGRDAPFEPQQGVALIQKAAELGDPDGLCLSATLHGAGAWIEQNWEAALNLLAAAAERGSFDAREQLCLMAERTSYDGQDVPKNYWSLLRRRIHLETLVQPRSLPEQISESPRVWLVRNFARDVTCERMIRKAQGKLKPAKMYDRQTGVQSYLEGRNNSDYMFDISETGLVLLLTRIRMSLLLSLPVLNMEPPQILHYRPGQELRAHFDFIVEEGGKGPVANDRAATFLVALNDDYEGGETEFLHTGLRWRGKTGDAIFFANLQDGKPDRTSLHAGRPVLRGEKWLLSQWVRSAAYTS